MRRLLLLVGLVPLLTGCFYLPIFDGSSSSGDGTATDAKSNVRASIPAIEAWNADHGTYAGMTVKELRTKYDYGIPDVKIAKASKTTYCVESTAGGETWSYSGPTRGFMRGGC
jgi:hypothetical protein